MTKRDELVSYSYNYKYAHYIYMHNRDAFFSLLFLRVTFFLAATEPIIHGIVSELPRLFIYRFNCGQGGEMERSFQVKKDLPIIWFCKNVLTYDIWYLNNFRGHAASKTPNRLRHIGNKLYFTTGIWNFRIRYRLSSKIQHHSNLVSSVVSSSGTFRDKKNFNLF